MKKTTTLLLATFAALTLGGCGGESSPAMTVDEAAVTAAQQISYSDQAVTGVTGDFPLITESEAGGYKFTVTYTAGTLVTYPEGYTFLSIAADGATATVVPPNYLDKTLDFQAKYGSFAQCYIETKLHYDGKEYAGQKYNIKVNAVSATTVDALYSAELNTAGIKVTLNGYYIGTYNTDDPYNGTWIADGNAGVMLYGLQSLPDGIKEGDPVAVSGTTAPYSGLVELKNPSVKILKNEAAIAKLTKPTPIDFTESTVWEYKNLSCKAHAVGTLSGVTMKDSNKVAVTDPAKAYTITANVNVGTAKLYIYCYAKYMSAAAFAAAAVKFVNDASVDVTGYLSYYSTGTTFDASKIQIVAPVFAA